MKMIGKPGLLLLQFLLFLYPHVHAEAPAFSCKATIVDGSLSIIISNESDAHVVMALDPRTIIYDIKYKIGGEDSSYEQKSTTESSLHPSLLGEYVFYPPANKQPIEARRFSVVKLPIKRARFAAGVLEILEFHLTVRAVAYDPHDSVDKVFREKEWSSVNVRLRPKKASKEAGTANPRPGDN